VYKFLVGTSEGKRPLEDWGVDAWSGFIWLRIGTGSWFS
jgi:hypothetical protein